MKSSFYKSLLVVLSCFLLATTCVKESEEQYTDEEESYNEDLYGKSSPEQRRKIAITDWHRYADNSQKLIAIAEANLNTIQLRIENDGDSANTELISYYNRSEKKLRDLKKQFSKEQKIFTGDPDSLTEESIEENRTFKRNFRDKLLELNISLDRVVEDEESTEYLSE